MAKKQPPSMQRKQQDAGMNKKALIWLGSIVGAIIVAMSILLALNN